MRGVKVIVVGVVIALLFGCAEDAPEVDPAPAPEEDAADEPVDSADEPVVVPVGALLPSTGAAAGFGEWARNGLELWAEEANERLETEGVTIELHVEDNGGGPDAAVAGYARLRDRFEVPVVVSSLTSATLAVMPRANDDEVVVFNGGNGSALLDAGPYFFSNQLNISVSGTIMAAYAAQEMGIERAAVLYRNDDYGMGGLETFSAGFEANGGEIVSRQAFAPDSTSLDSQAQAIAATAPDGVFVIALGEEFLSAMRALDRAGYDGPFLSDAGIVQPALLEEGGDLAEGRAFGPSDDWDPSAASGDAADFVDLFNTRFDLEPNISHVNYYEAGAIIEQAIMALRESGTEISGRTMREAILTQGTFSVPVTGTVQFDEANQFAVKQVAIFGVENGEFAIVEGLDPATVRSYLAN